jgi:hypothetical protein
MARELVRFSGRTLVILSGNDYTAKEFSIARSNSKAWSEALRDARMETIENADHTFSGSEWKERVADITASWISQER